MTHRAKSSKSKGFVKPNLPADFPLKIRLNGPTRTPYWHKTVRGKFYVPGFNPPSQKARREQRLKTGKRMLEPAELQLLLKAAEPRMRAMI